MKSVLGRWIDQMFDRADVGLARLQRRCPRCGGQLHRKFSLLDKLGLYFPVPHTIYAAHRCSRCHTCFRSFRSLTDLFLEVAWCSALFYFGEWKPIALTLPITWLATSYVLKDIRDASYDTTIAGILTGILWLLALVFGNEAFGDFFFNYRIVAIAIVLCFISVPFYIVLLLDRYTNFRLRPC